MQDGNINCKPEYEGFWFQCDAFLQIGNTLMQMCGWVSPVANRIQYSQLTHYIQNSSNALKTTISDLDTYCAVTLWSLQTYSVLIYWFMNKWKLGRFFTAPRDSAALLLQTHLHCSQSNLWSRGPDVLTRPSHHKGHHISAFLVNTIPIKTNKDQR